MSDFIGKPEIIVEITRWPGIGLDAAMTFGRQMKFGRIETRKPKVDKQYALVIADDKGAEIARFEGSASHWDDFMAAFAGVIKRAEAAP